jgi:hypothetical protein
MTEPLAAGSLVDLFNGRRSSVAEQSNRNRTAMDSNADRRPIMLLKDTFVGNIEPKRELFAQTNTMLPSHLTLEP